MNLGDALITIKAKDQASAKMNQIGKSTSNMTAKFRTASLAIAALGIAMIVAVGKMVSSYATAGDEVAKMAKRTGWGVEALSEMRYVAKIAGTEINALEKATKKMSKTILDASRGLETYTRSFTELGLSLEDIQRMSPEQAFWEIAYAISALEDPMKRSAYALEIFGRAGTDLLPMLDMTREEMERERQTAHDLGLVFTEETAKGAEDFKDATERLKGALTGLTNEIAKSVMPQLEDLATQITEQLKPAIAWLSKHPEVSESFVKLGGILGVAGLLGIVTRLINPWLLLASAILVASEAVSNMEGWVGRLLETMLPLAGLLRSSKELFAVLFGGARPKPGGGVEWPYAELAPGVREKYEHLLPEMPSLQYGGIVPGPIGEPVPIMAHGGEPFGGIGAKMQTRAVHVYIGSFMGDEMSLRDLTRRMQELMREEERRTAFSGINSGYFYGGSHP